METARQIRLMAIVSAVLVSATILFGLSVIWPGTSASAPSSGPWVERQVELPVGPTLPSCWFVSSTVVTDRFCLSLNETPAGYTLGGLFDHGIGTAAIPVQLTEGPPCLLGCPSSATWISPDGTGSLVWNFTTEATIAALA